MSPQPLMSPYLLAALQQLDTCTVANAIETFKVRLRNEGYCDSTIRCLFPTFPPIVGHAVTVRIRGRSPSMDGHAYIDNSSWWDHILSLPSPKIAVVQDLDAGENSGSFVGEVHAQLLRKLGCIGAITNGAVRDLPRIKSTGFALFARHVAVSHSYVHVVDVGQEVEIGGLKIKPGDWLHGDLHGVLSIPANIGDQIPAAAEKIRTREAALVALCNQPDLPLDQLRAALLGVLQSSR